MQLLLEWGYCFIQKDGDLSYQGQASKVSSSEVAAGLWIATHWCPTLDHGAHLFSERRIVSKTEAMPVPETQHQKPNEKQHHHPVAMMVPACTHQGISSWHDQEQTKGCTG